MEVYVFVYMCSMCVSEERETEKIPYSILFYSFLRYEPLINKCTKHNNTREHNQFVCYWHSCAILIITIIQRCVSPAVDWNHFHSVFSLQHNVCWKRPNPCGCRKIFMHFIFWKLTVASVTSCTLFLLISGWRQQRDHRQHLSLYAIN